MQPMSFDPAVASVGAHLIDSALRSTQAAATASTALTALTPAGAEDVSAQAAMAFSAEATRLLALQQAAQQELMRAGAAIVEIARMYTETDATAAANLVTGRPAPG